MESSTPTPAFFNLGWPTWSPWPSSIAAAASGSQRPPRPALVSDVGVVLTSYCPGDTSLPHAKPKSKKPEKLDYEVLIRSPSGAIGKDSAMNPWTSSVVACGDRRCRANRCRFRGSGVNVAPLGDNNDLDAV